ncbi:MAG: helix-turn-helix domain-containing protein [Patescibacteria group bacterium]
MPRANTKNELPLNEYLLQRRKFLKIRFSDLVSRTGIPAKHIKKIENGDWFNLPPGVYAKGFLKKYARTIGLDEGEICFRYEHELAEAVQVLNGESVVSRGYKSNLSGISKLKKLPVIDFIFRSSFRKIVLSALVLIVLTYMSWQFRVVLEKPNLVLSYPLEEDIVVSESKINLAGKTLAGAVVTINNETVYPEADGSFGKDVELLDGLNILEIKTVSRFGKETKITRRVTYNP